MLPGYLTIGSQVCRLLTPILSCWASRRFLICPREMETHLETTLRCTLGLYIQPAITSPPNLLNLPKFSVHSLHRSLPSFALVSRLSITSTTTRSFPSIQKWGVSLPNQELPPIANLSIIFSSAPPTTTYW